MNLTPRLRRIGGMALGAFLVGACSTSTPFQAAPSNADRAADAATVPATNVAADADKQSASRDFDFAR